MLKFKGSLKISGDKSISHRALILSAMSTGKARITNLLESEDVMSTLNILKELGIKIIKDGNNWIVYGNGTGGFIEPKKPLDCGNSGTTARLMIGAVSSNPINCTLLYIYKLLQTFTKVFTVIYSSYHLQKFYKSIYKFLLSGGTGTRSKR